jgi:hypothetical protein
VEGEEGQWLVNSGVDVNKWKSTRGKATCPGVTRRLERPTKWKELGDRKNEPIWL